VTPGGALESSVTLEEVFVVVGAKRVPLAPELAGYLVLEVAEHADPACGDVDPKSVYIGEEGSVALVKARREGAGDTTEGSVRGLLARLLEASGTQTPALAASARRKSGAGLRALVEEIEAALIPVNRAAGRRALARLAREVKRVTLGVGRNALPSHSDAAQSLRRASSPSHVPPREAGPSPSSPAFSKEEEPTTTRSAIPDEVLRKATPQEVGELPTIQFGLTSRGPSPSQADVDRLIDQFGVSGSEQQHTRDLKAMAGLEPTPPPATGKDAENPPTQRTPNESEVEALLSLGADGESPAVSAAAVKTGRAALATPPDDRQLPTRPSKVRTHDSAAAIHPPRSRQGGSGWVLALVAILGAGGFAIWKLRPFEPAARSADRAPPVAVPSASTRPATCAGTLVISDVPPHAEALLRAGQAPVDVERMPVGARLEFVATAEGYAPRRVVVPAGASWDTGPDGKPRYEAAAQLEKSRVKLGANDPWPAGEPGSEVGGQGPPGTVRVVSTPRGAEIWMLAGIGPEVRIDQVRCDQELDVLLAGPTTFRKRLHVTPTDFVPAEGNDGKSGIEARDRAGASSAPKTPGRIARISAK
jgi:hypothetical protein